MSRYFDYLKKYKKMINAGEAGRKAAKEAWDNYEKRMEEYRNKNKS